MSPSHATGTTFWLHAYLHASGIDATDKLLLIGLAEHVDAEDRCWPKMETLARYAEVSYATAKRRLAGLVKRGWLDRDRQRRESGNFGTYQYTLLRTAPGLNLSHGVPAPGDNLSPGESSPGRALARAHPGEPAEPDHLEPENTPPAPSDNQPGLIETAQGDPGGSPGGTGRQGGKNPDSLLEQTARLAAHRELEAEQRARQRAGKAPITSEAGFVTAKARDLLRDHRDTWSALIAAHDPANAGELLDLADRERAEAHQADETLARIRDAERYGREILVTCWVAGEDDDARRELEDRGWEPAAVDAGLEAWRARRAELDAQADIPPEYGGPAAGAA